MKRIIFHEQIGTYLYREDIINVSLLAEEYILRGVEDINTSCMELLPMAFSEGYDVIIASKVVVNDGNSFKRVIALTDEYDQNHEFYNVKQYISSDTLTDLV